MDWEQVRNTISKMDRASHMSISYRNRERMWANRVPNSKHAEHAGKRDIWQPKVQCKGQAPTIPQFVSKSKKRTHRNGEQRMTNREAKINLHNPQKELQKHLRKDNKYLSKSYRTGHQSTK